MKKILVAYFLALSLFSTQEAKTQYQSIFGQDSTVWVYEAISFLGTYQDTAYVYGDTLLYGIQYKIVNPYHNSTTTSHQLLLFREDTVEGKVWCRYQELSSPWDTLEQLVLNYSLQLGDTFSLYPNHLSMQADSVVVDSVYFDAVGRRCLRFDRNIHTWGQYEPFTMIEGVGSNYGILFEPYIKNVNTPNYLLCYYRDGAQAYLNEHYDTCDVYGLQSSLETKQLQQQLKLYPNPAQHRISIEKDYSGNEALETILIYNNLGQLLLEQPYSPTLELGALPAGIYRLLLRSKGLILAQETFIKH